jgi:hypothetical protein
MRWFWIVLLLIYILWPYDLLPDVMPLRGWIDDLIAAVLLWRYVTGRVSSGARPGGGQSARQRPESFETGGASAGRAADRHPRTPHEVLGLAPDAGTEEIKAAYRRLANQYHPDKVAHLGPEFQELAARRFKEIQQAYARLMGRP